MASNAIVTKDQEVDWSVIHAVVTSGDLSGLSDQQKTAYYRMYCESVGLNPVTQPFAYVKLQGGKLSLYALKAATEQLRQTRKITLRIVDQQAIDGMYIVTAEATLPDGRTDTDVGAVFLPREAGEARANAIMKAITKAKRRVTLSICGLGLNDETEVTTIPGAMLISADGEVNESVPAATSIRLPLGLRPEQWANLHSMATAKGVEIDPMMTPDQIAGAIRKAGGPAIPGQITPRSIKEALDRIKVEVEQQAPIEGEAREEEEELSDADRALHDATAQGRLMTAE